MNVVAYDETLTVIISSTPEADMSPADLIKNTKELIEEINTTMKRDIKTEMDEVISTMTGGKRRKTKKGKKDKKGKKTQKGKKGKKGNKGKKTPKSKKKMTRKNKKAKKTTRRK
jgi:high-affinity Fe2+/Pb2+ permease